MSPEFERTWPLIKRFEGGYVNHPNDPGGETKYGISKRSYPTRDIKNLTEEDAKAIYWRDYWVAGGCDKMPWPLCAIFCDTAIHSGRSRALEFLARTRNPELYLDLRELFLRRLCDKPSLAVFKKGWLNRITLLREVARDASAAPSV